MSLTSYRAAPPRVMLHRYPVVSGWSSPRKLTVSAKFRCPVPAKLRCPLFGLSGGDVSGAVTGSAKLTRVAS
jgi:hypothetical protein